MEIPHKPTLVLVQISPSPTLLRMEQLRRDAAKAECYLVLGDILG